MNWFKNLNAMPKLMLSSGLLLAFTTVIGFLGTLVLHQQNGEVTKLFEQDFAGFVAIKDFEVGKAKIAAYSRNAIIAASDSKGSYQEEVAKQEKRFDVSFKELKTNIKTARLTARGSQFTHILDDIIATLPVYEERSKAIFAAARSGDTHRASAALSANSSFLTNLNEMVARAAKLKLDDMEAVRKQQEAKAAVTGKTLIGLVSGTILVGMILSFRISRSFSAPLKAAVEVLSGLSAGDLTRRLPARTKDELGRLAQSLNEAMDSMQNALSEVGDSSSNLTSASRQLAKAAEALASGAQQQAQSIELTSVSLEQITATIRQNSDNAKHASQLAVSSRHSAEKGGKSATDTMTAMADIQASSSKISDIISTIDEIAFQTNLLSVNASVEAARAGAHGKGFKVVATEVRNLAQRSASAAKEIKALISGSVRKVENGSALVTSSGSTLKEIVTSVKRVSDIVGEIATASAEQTSGIEQVSRAMMQMDQVTQSNASQTEELSATAASLASQSSHLQELVSRFVLTRLPSVPAGTSSYRTPPALTADSTFPPDEMALKSDDLISGEDSNLSNLARRVGQSVKTDSHDSEFEEF